MSDCLDLQKYIHSVRFGYSGTCVCEEVRVSAAGKSVRSVSTRYTRALVDTFNLMDLLESLLAKENMRFSR